MVIRLKGNANPAGNTAENIIDWQQLFWLLVLGVVYILRDIVKIPMPDILFTGLCGAAFVFLSTGSAMGVYLFTSALTVPDLEIRIVYLAILLAKFFSQHRKVKVSMLLVVIGMAVLELLNLALFSEQSFVKIIYDAVFRLTYLAIPFFWFSEDYSREDYRRALLCYVAGVALGGAVLLWISVDTVGWELLLTGTDIRLGMNTTDGYETASQIRTGYNPNQLGIMFALVVSVVLSLADHKKMNKVLSAVIIVLSAFMIVLTKSRTGILLALGAVILYGFILFVRKGKMGFGVFFVAAIAVLAYGFTVLFPQATEDLLLRFQEQDDLTSGRDVLFQEYMTAWINDIWVFLFGYGAGSYKNMVSISNSPHNMIADIAIRWGLCGRTGIITMLVSCYKKYAGKMKAKRWIAYLPAIVELISLMSSQYLAVGYPHMRLCFWLLVAKAFDTAEEGL